MSGVADKIYVIRSPCNIAILRSSEFLTHILVYLCPSIFPFFATYVVKKMNYEFLFSSQTFRHRFLFCHLIFVYCFFDITFSFTFSLSRYYLKYFVSITFCLLKLSSRPHLYRIHPFTTYEFPFSASSFLNILKTTCLTSSSPKHILPSIILSFFSRTLQFTAVCHF
jgi:hypothetical protein